MNIILGEFYVGNRKIPADHYQVPCPSCLDPMTLSADKLIDIYSYFLISDSMERLEVMCSDCADEEVFHEEQNEPKMKKIRKQNLYEL